MSYDQQLAFNLRLRRWDEAAIGDVIAEMRAHCGEDDAAKETEFGKPEEYAAQFPRGQHRTLGVAVIIGGVILAGVYLAVLLLAAVVLRDALAVQGGLFEVLPPLIGTGGALAILLVSIVTGFFIDWRRSAPTT